MNRFYKNKQPDQKKLQLIAIFSQLFVLAALMITTPLLAGNPSETVEIFKDVEPIQGEVNPARAKKTEEVGNVNRWLIRGRKQWADGELSQAIKTLEEAQRLDAENETLTKTLESMRLQKKLIDERLDEAGKFINEGKLMQAKRSLAKAGVINEEYPPYIKLLKNITKNNDTDILVSEDDAITINKPEKESVVQLAKPLFDGKMSEEWREFAAAGGNFKKFAQFKDNQLVIDVLPGSSWGKTGLWSVNPVVKVPALKQANTAQITFKIDKDNSSDFVFALIPNKKGGQDEWWAHDIRVGLFTDKESQSSTLTLWIKRAEIMKTNVESASLDQINIVLRPDGVLLVTDKTDKTLLQGVIPDDFPEEGYHIYALSQAPKVNLATKLSLLSIYLKEGKFVHQGDPSEFLADSQKTILFDGQVLGRRWIQFQAHGGDFNKHAQLKDGMLTVDVPENSSWGKVGIMSPEPLVWLDKFTEGSQVKLSFKFDSDITTGFMIGLARDYGLNGNDPSQNARYLLHWRKSDTGEVKATSQINYNKNVINAESTAQLIMPDELSLVLTNNGIKVGAKGFPDTVTPWDEIRPGQSFRVYVYTHPDKANQAVKMALKEILIERTAGKSIRAPQPEEGVEPLPETTLFDGNPSDLWEEAGVNGAEFSKHGRFENHRMIAEIPVKYSWGKTGLLSKQPVLNLDERVIKTPHKLTLKVDPRETTGFQVMFSSSKVAAMWPHSIAAVSFIRHTQGPNAGKYVLGLSAGSNPYQSWSRAVDAEWVEKHWDGTLEIENGNNWMAVHIPVGPSIRGSGFNVGKNSKLYMTVYAHPENQSGGSHLVLEKITSEWVMPDGMSKLDRWEYVDNENFKPDLYLDDLTEENTLAINEETSADQTNNKLDDSKDNDPIEQNISMALDVSKEAVFKSTSSDLYMTAKFSAGAIEASCGTIDGRARRSFSGSLFADPNNKLQLVGQAKFSPEPGGNVSYYFSSNGRTVSTFWQTHENEEKLIRWVRVPDMGFKEQMTVKDLTPTLEIKQ